MNLKSFSIFSGKSIFIAIAIQIAFTFCLEFIHQSVSLICIFNTSFSEKNLHCPSNELCKTFHIYIHYCFLLFEL